MSRFLSRSTGCFSRARYVVLVCWSVVILLSGCSSTPVEPPAALVEFKPELAVKTVWSTRIGSGADEEDLRLFPRLAGDTLYVNDHKGTVVSLQADTGKQNWEIDLNKPLTSGPGYGDGKVVIGSADGQVIALSADDGKALWRAQLSSEILAPPAVGEGVVVAHTVDGKLFALDAADGAQLWIYDRTVPTLTLRGTSAPVILSDIVVDGFASGKIALLVLRDGRVLWEKSIAVPRGRSELERMVDIDASPLVMGSVLYVVSYQGRVAAIDLQSGRVLWSRSMSSYTGLAADERTLYLSDDEDRVWALNRSNGASLWQQEALQRRSLTAPAVYKESVVVGDMEGYLHWMARSDGHFVARFPLGSGVRVAPVVSGERLYAYSNDGKLFCLEAAPRR
ncbi:MAG TPA: outer membrane protein assembly factor BamB [Gammaproteobacteria bacterium]|nr:outer membrane protein assembly factor BamB [Gammaproteobacteria bacterium]